MTRQIALNFEDHRRFEIPASRATWVDAQGARHELYVGAHLIDESWPWWRPNFNGVMR